MNSAELDVGLDTRLEIKRGFHLIEELSKELKVVCTPYHHAPHVVSILPIREDASPLLEVPVHHKKGVDAWNMSMDCYAQFYRLEHQHPMACLRAPGILYVENLSEVQVHVARLNQAKKALKALITSIDSGKRNKLVSSTLPGVIWLQVYRKIEVFSEPVRTFVFSWVNTTSSKKISLQEVVALVDRDIELRKNGAVHLLDIPEFILERERKMLLKLSAGAVLRQCRPIAPHPRLMVFKEGGGRKADLTYHANLPLISGYDSKAKITLLSAFKKNDRVPAKRKDSKSKTLLIPRLNLYQIE